LKKCTLNQDDIDKLYIEIGKKVKKFREDANLSQLELALLIGHKSVGAISVGEIYHNRKHFNIEQLAKIANVLNIDLKEFF